ncbi:N-alpha-acetyltransferase 25, NatB auxiliary subunit-like [Tigriopus californicus]|uniref:N-alpha-acetyltransferase 25, NatB auxiliary subunit-like n=1 Tax=Tigriopus californicus TaxID=6832 RepID=UPI0027D9F0CA|nr:N-alpha-acetyltransferase 25, NatB auxiliary subunit-like [Tigriopus californicus]
MAKNHNSAASAVGERRLRPIYDWLDHGNNKRAWQEAEKVLKKQPDFPCGRALLALALVRLGRDVEAQRVLRDLAHTGPTEDATLQAMTIAYRELESVADICRMYEIATQKEPNNEDLLSHLFMSYVRVSDYKKQQRTALQLFKVQPKNPYYFWAVMSVVLQASADPQGTTAQTLMFPLAERMIKKMHEENKLNREQETHLFLLVLELQDKYAEALEILESPLGKALNESTSYLHFFNFKKLEYLKALKRWPDINRLAQTILVSLPDQWNVYVDLVESVFELEALGTLNTSLDIISNVDLLFKYLRTIQSSDIRSRGPFLAEMEVQLRMIQREPTRPELMTGLQTLLYHYFDTFSSRGCCFSDMRPYLEHLSQQEADILIPALKLLSLVPPQETFIPMGAVTRLVSCYQVLRFCEATRPISMDEHVDLLVSQFNLCQGAVLDVAPTESRPPDMFMVMAAHQLWSEWRNTGQDRWFLKAITLLEFALQFSPNNFHIRLVLIKLYNEAGAVGCAFNAYNGLELKHIQLDSMGYLIIRALQICGHFESTFSLVGSTLRFFNSNQKDIVDHIISAYRFGSFDKIREFVKLRDRLANSQHNLSLKTERILLDLLTETTKHAQTVQMMSYLEVDPNQDEIPWEKLVDNRDFQVSVSWEKSEILKPETIKTDFQDDQNFLRLRSLCLRVCVALIYLSEDIHPAREILGEEPSNLKVNHPNDTSTNAKPSQVKAEKLSALVRSLIAQIESVLESLQIEGPAPVFLTGPCPTRLHQYVLQGHPQTFVRMVKAVLSVQAFILARPGNTQHGSHNLLEDESPLIRALAVFRDEFEPMVARTLKDFPDFAVRCLNRRLHLENLYNVIESGNFCCLLWGVCHSLLIPVLKGGSGTSGKRSKKKKEQQQPKSPLSSASIDEANVGENYRHQFNTTQQSLVEAMSSLTTFTHGLRPTNHKAAAAEVEAAAVATSAAASLASSTEQLAENLEKLSLANKEAMKNGSSSIEGTTFEEEETQAGEFNTSHGSTRPADEPLQYQTLRELPLDLCQRIEDSYEVSFSQFAGLLERKVSYLRALTL